MESLGGWRCKAPLGQALLDAARRAHQRNPQIIDNKETGDAFG
jgi:hypothetical protein